MAVRTYFSMLYFRCNPPDTIEGNCDRDALVSIHLPLPPRFAINVVKNLSIHHIRGVAVNMGGVATDKNMGCVAGGTIQ
jgi:hypothetical protein